MGGGAAMRAVGKAAGIGVLKGGVRGEAFSAASSSEQAVRNVSRPVSSAISIGGGSSGGADVAAIQKAAWEADREFEGVEEDLVLESSQPEPIARVVFSAPTLEEAKDATADLKEALKKVYLSSPESGAYGNGGTVKDGPSSSLPLLANSENLKNKSFISTDHSVASVSTPAFNAFKLLSESPAVQSVVASIAADQHVWDAVMQNNDLKEFMLSQKSNTGQNVWDDVMQNKDFEEFKLFQSNAGVGYQEFSSNFEESFESSPGVDTADQSGDAENSVFQNFKKYFSNKMEYVVDFSKEKKIYVVEMVSKNYRKFFGSSPAEKTTAEDGDGARSFMENNTKAAILVGLIIMVIKLVVFKRV